LGMLLLMGKQLAVLLGEWVRRPLPNELMHVQQKWMNACTCHCSKRDCVAVVSWTGQADSALLGHLCHVQVGLVTWIQHCMLIFQCHLQASSSSYSFSAIFRCRAHSGALAFSMGHQRWTFSSGHGFYPSPLRWPAALLSAAVWQKERGCWCTLPTLWQCQQLSIHSWCIGCGLTAAGSTASAAARCWTLLEVWLCMCWVSAAAVGSALSLLYTDMHSAQPDQTNAAVPCTTYRFKLG